MALLEVEDLKVGFETPQGTLWAVRGVSFCVAPGQTLAIVGESGCGKTVLCRNLVRLCTGNTRVSGSILWKGEQLLRLTQRQMRSVRGAQIAYLPQDPRTALDPTFPIGAQIVEGILAHQKMSRRQAKGRALELLGLVRLPEPERLFSRYPYQLSGGMQQRCALAVALACDPELLILDEPTTALDATVQAEVLALLSQLKNRLNMAMLLITHDFGVAARLADELAVMYAGKLVEGGPAREVLYQPRHPYTWALLACLPGARLSRGARPAGKAAEPSRGPLADSSFDAKPGMLRQDGPGPEQAGAGCGGHEQFGREAAGWGEIPYLPGSPPDLLHLPEGDAFAPRNAYALAIDEKEEPPLFWASQSHWAATWLLHPSAPEIAPPVYVREGEVIVEEGYFGYAVV